jgi:hypothetical protein
MVVGSDATFSMAGPRSIDSSMRIGASGHNHMIRPA